MTLPSAGAGEVRKDARALVGRTSYGYERVSRTTEITISALRKELLSVAVNPTLNRDKVHDEAWDLALEQRRVAIDDVGVVRFCHVRLGHHCAAKTTN